MVFSAQSIEQLIAQGEHQELDFKYRIDDASKIARTLVAFANTDGGRLLVGVKDNGKIVGVKSDEDFYVVESAAELFSKPAIGFELRKWDVMGKKVLEIYIPPSSQRPHRSKNDQGVWKPYFRKADKNLIASGVQIKVWQMGYKRMPPAWNYSEPEQLLFNLLQEKEELSFSAFCKKSGLSRSAAEDTLARLVSWGVIKMNHSESGCKFQSC